MIPMARIGRAGRRPIGSGAFVTSASETVGGTSITHSGMSIGDANSTRLVVVGIVGTNGTSSSPSLTSATIGGVSATITKQYTGGSSGDYTLSAIFIAAVPTGTTADIVMNFSQALDNSHIAIFRLVNVPSSTAYATAQATRGSSPRSTTINIPDKGLLIVTGFGSNTNNVTWSGVTEAYDETYAGVVKGSGGINYNMTSETGRTITMTQTSATAAQFVAASWGG